MLEEAQIVSRRYTGKDRASLSRPVIQAAAHLLQETPPPRRVRVVGVQPYPEFEKVLNKAASKS